MTVSLYKDRAGFSVSTTELSIVNGNSTPAADTTPGFYVLCIDGVANMAKGDEFLVKVKEKAATGGTQRIVQEFRLRHAQSSISWAVPYPLAAGWDMTIQRIAGSDRTFDISIRKA
jgi:hypothetical protein